MAHTLASIRSIKKEYPMNKFIFSLILFSSTTCAAQTLFYTEQDSKIPPVPKPPPIEKKSPLEISHEKIWQKLDELERRIQKIETKKESERMEQLQISTPSYPTPLIIIQKQHYTLTWQVTQRVPIECPDYKPDPYTGNYPSSHCAVYHCEIRTTSMKKTFDTLEEAEAFKKAAPSSCTNFKYVEEAEEIEKKQLEIKGEDR